VEPVEINAGAWYLRALRHDDRVDDVPALVGAFADPAVRRWAPPGVPATPEAAARHVARRGRQWADDERCSWAVADPVTGALRAEVGLADLDLAGGTAELAAFAAPGARGTGVLEAVVPVVLRFAFGGLGLHRVAYRHADDDAPAEAMARASGFVLEGRERGAHLCDGERRDGLRWSRLATDR
jgi:RimJ/RimL family protein N-acetyltransferase